MRNIRKIFVRAAAVLVFLFVLESTVRFLYEPYNTYSILSTEEYEELKGTLDTLFVGSSHSYFAFDPQLFDERMGTNSFNLASGAQPLFMSYQLVREGIEINPIKNVVLGISFSSLLKNEDDNSVLGGYDRLITLRGKIRTLLEDTDDNRRLHELFYSTRVDNWFDFSAVAENVRHKLSDTYREDVLAMDDNEYGYRGYWYSENVFNGQRNTDENRGYNVWDESKVKDINLEYLIKIMELCRDEGINLRIVILPVTQAFLDYAGDYEAMHDYYAKLADEYGAELYDCINYDNRAEDFPNEYFRDTSHLNRAGSQAFGNLLVDWIKEREGI